MKTPTRDDLRHSILEILYRKTNNQQHQKSGRLVNEWYVSVQDIAKELMTNRLHIRQLTSIMWTSQEIGIDSNENGEEFLYIRQAGIVAHNEQSYKKINFRKFGDKAYDITRWVIPIILAIIALYSAIKSSSLGHNNRQEIQQLSKRLDSLSQKK
jgi:hypothetical protein